MDPRNDGEEQDRRDAFSPDERGRRGGRGNRGEHPNCREGDQRLQGAQTYRRGRIVTFLERLEIKRATLARQLAEPGFQSIHTVISGELKAIEQVIEEYKYVFDLQEENSLKADSIGTRDE